MNFKLIQLFSYTNSKSSIDVHYKSWWNHTDIVQDNKIKLHHLKLSYHKISYVHHLKLCKTQSDFTCTTKKN